MGSISRRQVVLALAVAMQATWAAPVAEAGGRKRCRSRCVQVSTCCPQPCYTASALVHSTPVTAPVPAPSEPHPTLQNVYPQPQHTTVVFDNFPCSFTPAKAQLLFVVDSVAVGILTDDTPTYNATTRVLTVDGNIQLFLAAGEGIADITVTVTGPTMPTPVAKKTYLQKLYMHNHAP